MIIDFHTHVFPDKLAQKALNQLSSQSNLAPFLDGTLNGLLQNMKDNHIDYSVVLPVMTNPKQFHSINQFAQELNKHKGIISLGGMHPDLTNLEESFETIVNYGLKGIKLHPDYQGPTYIDDDKYTKIIQGCIDRNLCIVIHAGMDVGLPVPIHCPPDKSYLLLKKLQLKDRYEFDSKIVLAHLGGMYQWDLVEKLLVGKNIYLDLAYISRVLDIESASRIIKLHGADRILFATDSPWIDQGVQLDYVEHLKITSNEKDMILYKNACRLLDL